MSADNLAKAIFHATEQLAQCEVLLARHEARTYGMCTCLRPLPCPVAIQSRLFANHWRARLAYFEGQRAAVVGATQILPVVADDLAAGRIRD